MSTIAEQLVALAQIKADIKAAIIDKGVTVSDSDPFSVYATKIGQISGGGGDSSFIEKWDFTTGSLTGVNGTAVTLGGSATVAAGTGVSFTTGADRIYMPTDMLKIGRKIDIEFGTMSHVGTNGVVMAWSTTSTSDTMNIQYRSNLGKWIIESPSVEQSTISDSGYFSNSKMSIVIDADSKIHIYRDDTAVWNPTTVLTFSGLNFWTIGANHNNFTYYNAVIRSITIYSTEDIGKIADFDFKTGLTDSVNGFNATLAGTGITRDSTGVIFTAAGNMINLPPVLFSVLRTYEIKIGAMNAQSFNNGALFGYNTYQNGSTHGFAYHTATSRWGVWDPNNGWRDTNISDTNYFANSVVKIEIGADRLWKIYKDDVLCFEPTGAFPMNGVVSFTIGGPQGNSFYTMTIEGLVIRSK